MLYDNPKYHILLQILCFFTALFGIVTLIVDLLIGSILLGIAVIVFALHWLYMANIDDDKF